MNYVSKVLATQSCPTLFATPWTVACQAPLSMGFSRQECWSRLPCDPPGGNHNYKGEKREEFGDYCCVPLTALDKDT